MNLFRATAAALAILSVGASPCAEAIQLTAPAARHETLRISAATDFEAMEPLIRDFQASRPDISIEYDEGQTVDIFERAQSDCRVGRSSADLIISSSTDQLVRLSNDGCALAAPFAPPTALPRWTSWRREVFGFTFEPGVIVYNTAAVPEADRRRTRSELIDLLRSQPDAYAGRVGIYDIEKSGIGYLLALYDARATTVYGRLLETLSRGRVVIKNTTTELLTDLASGRLSIGYNLLGSYAVAAVRKGAPLAIVVPRDFAVVLSRTALVPRHSGNPDAAFSFLAYLLSNRGQRRSAESSFYFSFDGPLPDAVDGPATLASSTMLRPIEVGVESLFVQDRAKRKHFISEWRRTLGILPAP